MSGTNGLRILVHDYSGHPFQVQLSRELSRRGHDVVHSYCDAYLSGRGRLHAEPGEAIRFDPIACGEQIDKLPVCLPACQGAAVRRTVGPPDEAAPARRDDGRERPHPNHLRSRGLPRAAGHPLPGLAPRCPGRRDPVVRRQTTVRRFHLPAKAIEVGEKWCARRAKSVVVIAESFRSAPPVADRPQGHRDPQLGPLDEIYPVNRKNDWAVEHSLDDTKTLLYSGTLGLKHNPALLVRLADRSSTGQPVRLAVVNEGPAAGVLRVEAERLGVPLTLLPFQPYERLPEVLGSGDILVVLLKQDAGAFSVPSKTLSYLCAGRPILGLMPAENLASELVLEAEGFVLTPSEESLPSAAAGSGRCSPTTTEQSTSVPRPGSSPSESRACTMRENVRADPEGHRRPGHRNSRIRSPGPAGAASGGERVGLSGCVVRARPARPRRDRSTPAALRSHPPSAVAHREAQRGAMILAPIPITAPLPMWISGASSRGSA